MRQRKIRGVVEENCLSNRNNWIQEKRLEQEQEKEYFEWQGNEGETKIKRKKSIVECELYGGPRL